MKRVVGSLVLVFAFAIVCSAQTTFYFPQIANGGGWRTTIFLTNPAASGGATANGDIRFIASDASNFNLQFTDSGGNPVGSGNMIPFAIPAGQTRKYVSTGTGGLVSGFGIVNALSGTVDGTSVFSFYVGSTLSGEASVAGVPALAKQAIFVDLQSGFNTAVAWANPTAAAANMSIQLISTDGTPVVAGTTQSLAVNRHGAGFVAAGLGGTLFPTNPPVFAGIMRIESNTPIATIALRFSPGGAVFTTLAPVPLASLINSGVLWIEKNLPAPLATFARLLGRLPFRLG